jgi:hypothetical protein
MFSKNSENNPEGDFMDSKNEAKTKSAAGILLAVGGCVAAAAAALAASAALIRGLGPIAGKFAKGNIGEFAADVFGALKNAELRPPLLPLAALAFYALLWYRFGTGKKAGNIAFAIILIPLTLILTVVLVWFTAVNGIRFGDVAKSLSGFAENGLFDIL